MTRKPPVNGWGVWGRPLGLLGAILLGPLLLLPTRLAPLALTWVGLLLLGGWCFLTLTLVSHMVGTQVSPITWVDLRVRAWVARFAPDPERLWLQWAREAPRDFQARAYLDCAVALGGAEALFQEGLVFLEGGYGSTGQVPAVARFRKAAGMGHPEAAFRLAEALRTAVGVPKPFPAEAEVWYRRSAAMGFGPAAAWLAHAYSLGDGVAVDEVQAQRWAEQARRHEPLTPLSHHVLRHDAAPEDVLVRSASRAGEELTRAVDRVLAHRAGRWLLAVGATCLIVLPAGAVLTIFIVGSMGFFFLPLFMLAVPLLMLTWMAIGLRREGPSTRRDKLREAAEAGDPEACFRLAEAHRAGTYPLPKDDLTAFLWYRKAAEAGHRDAMAALAQAYLGGHGVIRDPRAAAHWAEAARRESTS